MTAPFPRDLESARLRYRQIRDDDAPLVQRVMSVFDVSTNLLRPPLPYSLDDARDWITTSRDLWAREAGFPFIVERRDAPGLVGAVGVHPEPPHARAELGYWLDPAHWGKGYATEAARTLLDAAFRFLPLERVHAGAYHWNPASARVLIKIGMKPEGVQRSHILRHGRRGDLHLFGILRAEHAALAPST